MGSGVWHISGKPLDRRSFPVVYSALQEILVTEVAKAYGLQLNPFSVALLTKDCVGIISETNRTTGEKNTLTEGFKVV